MTSIGFLLMLAFEPVGQLRAAQTQQAGGAGQIAAAALDRQGQHLRLQGLDRHAGIEHLRAQAQLVLGRTARQPALRVDAVLRRLGLVSNLRLPGDLPFRPELRRLTANEPLPSRVLITE